MLLFSIVEWTPIILAIITGIITPATLYMQFKLKQSNDRQEIRQKEQAIHIEVYRKEVNGHMTELLAAKKQEGKQEQKDETEAKEL